MRGWSGNGAVTPDEESHEPVQLEKPPPKRRSREVAALTDGVKHTSKNVSEWFVVFGWGRGPCHPACQVTEHNDWGRSRLRVLLWLFYTCKL